MTTISTYARRVDYSVAFVDEETGLELVVVTNDGDYVYIPNVNRLLGSFSWSTNKVLDVSPDGKTLAYISERNSSTNIFIKDISRQGGVSIQRTKRSNIIDFAYSPNGKYICFSEKRGSENQIYRVDSNDGYICRQITSDNKDFSPRYSADMSKIFFVREENNGYSVWSHDVNKNVLSSYSVGLDAYPLDNESAYLCSRTSENKRGEIWKVNYKTGVEECILSDPNRSFTTPTLSPDGKWVLFVGSSLIPNNDKNILASKHYKNTDLFICRTDGTEVRQLTYHPADDLSPVWGKDGKYIYFISQRGSNSKLANVWRMKSGL